MDIVIMAGGRGSRLGNPRKPFMVVCGRRLIDVVLDVARRVRNRRRIYVCTRIDTLHELFTDLDHVEVIACPGAGYVEDLGYILSLTTRPTLVLPADIPFLTVDVVEKFLDAAASADPNADVVTLMVCREDVCRETGISLFRSDGGRWANVYFEDCAELKDIDTPEDLKWAESLCESTAGIGGLD